MDPTVIAALDSLGRKQHGLVTRQQAHDVLGPDRTKHWLRDGRLRWVQPRVLALAGTTRTRHQDLLAASLSAHGPSSHRAAAWMWGIADEADEADVSIRYPRQARLRPPAVVHRIKDLDDGCVVRRQGIPITNPMRTIVDLGLTLPWWAVDDALGRAIASRLLPLRAVITVREELARRGRNGTGVVQRVFDERLLRGADEDSGLELRLLRVIRRFGLPRVTFQHEVWHDGRFVGRVDAAYPARQVAIEADGFGSHSSPEAFQQDRERQNALVLLGWQVLRFTRNDIVRRQRHVADVISSVL